MTGRSGSGPQASRPVLPETIAGTRYRVSRLLGEGGSKLVYVARDTALDRDVAIALFRVEGLDEAGRQRVTREARAMGRLGDNPNIVNVYDIGEEKGQPFIVSQYMPGGTLDDLLRRAPGGRLMAPEVIRLAEQVCGALEYAHSLGIIHRDVKPANVFLTADGQARLGDFGLAIAPDQSRLTMKGMMVGTAAYMPPEQVLGRPLEARSDLYSLGAMLYELLTGAPPFTGADLVAIVTQHVNAAPERPGVRAAGVPAALDELILRLLAKEPAARPTALQVRESLRAIAGAGHASIDQLASSVVVERPNLTAHAAPDGTVSILFSDIENSTKMTERLGDVAAQEMLHLHNRIIREQVAAQRGYEVKTMGDGFMIAFNSGRRALLCAIGVQRAFAENNARDPSKQLRVRIGLNTGEVIHEGGDFFGKAVILAARIGAAAEGAEILVSQTFRDITSGMSDLRYDSGRDLELKGLAGTYHVYRALWE
ncbi:MAG TPA: protein kinase, partial [Candidatus Binataceae bacterium]|nr:protein kinase [Candidatus Binataceae bacterium]